MAGELDRKHRTTPYQANRTLGVLSKMFNLAEVGGLRPDEIWKTVIEVVSGDMANLRSRAVPDDVKRANREEHERMLDGPLLGLLVKRAAAEGVTEEGVFEGFIRHHAAPIREISREHPFPAEECLAKAAARQRVR